MITAETFILSFFEESNVIYPSDVILDVEVNSKASSPLPGLYALNKICFVVISPILFPNASFLLAFNVLEILKDIDENYTFELKGKYVLLQQVHFQV